MHTHACTYINQDIHGVRAASSRRGRHVRQVTSSWCVTQQQREKPTPQRPQSLRAQSTNTSQTQQACKPLVSKSLLAVGCQQRMPQRQWYLQGQRHIVVQTMQQHAGGRKWVVANTGVGVRWHMSARNKKHGFGTLYLWHIAPRKGAPLRHETPRRSVACSKQLFCSEAQRLLSIKPQSTSLEQYDGHHTRNNEPRPCCQHHNCASMVIQPQPCNHPCQSPQPPHASKATRDNCGRLWSNLHGNQPAKHRRVNLSPPRIPLQPVQNCLGKRDG